MRRSGYAPPIVGRVGGLDLAPEPIDLNERIRAVCERADLPYKSSHVLGRHSFATNALNAGVSVRVAMDAGGWDTSASFLESYCHTVDAGRVVMDRFNAIHYADQF